MRIADIVTPNPVVAFADEPLRCRRASNGGVGVDPFSGSGSFRGRGGLVGMISLNDLLRARIANLEDERARERVLRIRMPFGRQVKPQTIPLTEGSDFRR